MESKNKKFKLDLDYSSKFYPIFMNKKYQSLFCFTAQLKEEVDPVLLEKTINEIINRYPAFKVRLRCNFFWHYFEGNTKPVKVFETPSIPLKPLNLKETNGYLFRLHYKKNSIGLDMFHALCDGTGAVDFLKAILLHYFKLKGYKNDFSYGIKYLGENVDPEENENAYNRYYKKVSLKQLDLKSLMGQTPARMTGSLKLDGNITTIVTLDSKEISCRAEEKGISFTSYLSGALILALAKETKTDHPIVLMVPVNFRRFFPSKTVRNFVGFIRVVVQKKEDLTLSECVQAAHTQLRSQLTEEKLSAFMSSTVKAQKSPVFSLIPLFLKTFFLKLGKIFFKSRQSLIFSNVGRFKVPAEFGVERVIVNMNTSINNPISVGAVAVNDKLSLVFSRQIKENNLMNTFCSILSDEGISVESEEY